MFFKKKPIATVTKPSSVKLIDDARPMDKPFEFDSTSYDKALDQHVAIRDENFALDQKRRLQMSLQSLIADKPSAGATQLIGKLPHDLSLIHLFSDYPRILNKVAIAWGDHRAFFVLMDDLMIDKRGGREGFPFNVAVELTRLTDHYEQFIGKRPGGHYDVIQKARTSLF